MMEDKRVGLVAMVLRWMAGRFGGSGATLARRTGGGALAANDGSTEPVQEEPGCPDPAHCPPPAATGVALAS